MFDVGCSLKVFSGCADLLVARHVRNPAEPEPERSADFSPLHVSI